MLDLLTPEGRLDRVTVPLPAHMVPADSMPDLSVSAQWHRGVSAALKSGDRVVVLVNGFVSARRATLLRDMGFQVEVLNSDLGEDVPARDLARVLGRDLVDEVKAVFVLLVERSSGVISDLVAVRRAMDESFHDALLLVEASAASFQMPSDDIGADVVIADGEFASVRTQLDAHDGIVAAFRLGLAALDLGFVARRPRIAAHAVSAIRLSEIIDAAEVARRLWALNGIQADSFYDPARGQILSIAHPVGMTGRDCLSAIATLESALFEAGAGIIPGAGMSAVRAHLGLDDGDPASSFDIAAE